MLQNRRSHSIFFHQLRSNLVTVLLSVILIGASVDYISEELLIGNVLGSLKHQSNFRKERIDRFILQQKRWMAQMAQSDNMRNQIEKISESYALGTEGADLHYQLTENFRDHYKITTDLQDIHDLFLISPTGKLIFSMTPMETEIGEDLKSSGFYGANPFSLLVDQLIDSPQITFSQLGWIEHIGATTILIGGPIYSVSEPSRLVAFVARPTSMAWLNDLLTSYSGLGTSGEVVLAEGEGEPGNVTRVKFISQFRNGSERQPDERCSALLRKQFSTLPITQAVSGISNEGWDIDYSCREIYGIWTSFPDVGWGMLVKQDREEIMAPVLKQRITVLATIPIIMLLLFWLVWKLARTIANPIEQLTRDTGNGDIQNSLEGRVKEINQLIDAVKSYDLKLQKADKTKNDFMATMSHELRTPLASILGYSEILMDEITDQGQLKNLMTIRAAGENQLALVNDILDMNKIESGKIYIHENPYSFTRLLHELHDMLSISAQEAGLLLIIEQKNCEKFQLLGDSQRIKQILVNLIGNAIKFTERGTVSLSTEVVGNFLQFSVTDTGIGINPDNMKRLFEPFEQEDGSISRRFGGTGLGLFISHNLADMLGGKISATSEVGKGSTFTLSIPYKTTDQEDEPVRFNNSRRQMVSVELLTGHVLVAEDTPAVQLLIRRILEKYGIRVTIVGNGLEAVEKTESDRFDLILMDMQMPVMDGVEACRQIKSRGLSPPIIAVTANVYQKHRDAFKSAGCDGFIQKPINQQELKKILTTFLEAKREEHVDGELQLGSLHRDANEANVGSAHQN